MSALRAFATLLSAASAGAMLYVGLYQNRIVETTVVSAEWQRV